MPPKRIVHLTSAHPALDTRIFLKECKTLVQNGYEVELIVPHQKSEIVDGVSIRAVPKSKNRWQRIFKTAWDVCRMATEKDACIYHFHDPELLPVGILLKLRKKKVIYDVHEDVPSDILEKEYIPWALRIPVAKLMNFLEWISGLLFDGIIAVTPGIAKRFAGRRTVLVQNFPIPEEFKVISQVPYRERPNTIVYAGAIHYSRNIKEIIQAMERVPERLNATLTIAGFFSDSVSEKELRSLPAWLRINFLGWQTRGQIAHLFNCTRAGLALFRPTPNNMNGQPTKLFEYMAAGLPIIASDFPVWRKIVQGAGCGLLVDPMNLDEIAKAIQWLLEHPKEAETMGLRGKRAIIDEYNWSFEKEKLITLYSRIIGSED